MVVIAAQQESLTALLDGLGRVPALADLAPDQLRWFASMCSQVRVEPGEAYVHEGDPADAMFVLLEGGIRARRETGGGVDLRIPMMPISHSDLMPISAERSDAGPSQCEIVIDIRQEFCWFSLS